MPFSTKEWLSKMRRDLVGLIGALITSLCCLGIPVVISFVSAVGLGFFLKDAILVPLLMLFLFITLMGPYLGLKHHGNPWPLLLGTLSTLITMIFTRIVINTPLALLGLSGLAGSTVLNTWLRICRREMGTDTRCDPLHNREKKSA